MERLLQLGSPSTWPRDQATLREQARQIVQDVRAILPVDQYVSPLPALRFSILDGLFSSAALKKLISELPSMSEQELAAAGELGTSRNYPPLHLRQIPSVFTIRRLRVSYMFCALLRDSGRKRDGCRYGITRSSDRGTRDHEIVKYMQSHILP